VMMALALIGTLLARSPGEPRFTERPRFGPVPGPLVVPALDRPVRGREAELERLRELSRTPGGRFVVLSSAVGWPRPPWRPSSLTEPSRRAGSVLDQTYSVSRPTIQRVLEAACSSPCESTLHE